MNKIWSIFQYAYLVIAVVFLIDGILGWNSDKEKSLLQFGFAIFITIIFFFKRKFRRKIEERNSNNN